MAKEKKIEEKIYTIPLRREWVKQSRVRRANRSLNVIRGFVEKHTRAGETSLSSGVNELVWTRGAKKPPGKVKVSVRVEEGIAFARLPEEPLPQKEGEKSGDKKGEKQAEGKEKQERIEPKTQTEKTKENNQKKEVKEKSKEKVEELSPEEKEAQEIWKEAEKKTKSGDSGKG